MNNGSIVVCNTFAGVYNNRIFLKNHVSQLNVNSNN